MTSPTRSRGSRAPRSGPWLALPALAPLVVWLESARAGRVLAPGDGLTYYLPVQVLAARTWSQGIVPGWDPWSFGGSPLLATSQVGALYPPNLVHLILPAAAAHDLLVMTAFAVAGVGAALLARSLTGDPVAGAACGVAFGLSGFLFGHLNHLSMVATAAWLPWAFWGVERLVARPRPIRLLAAAAPLTAAALAGHPQLFLVVLAVTALWGVGMAIDRRSVRPALLAGAAIVSGVLLGAVQLLPVAAHLGVSDRSSLAFDEAMSWSFSPSHSLLVVLPNLFGTQGGSGPFTVPYGGEWSATELSGYVGAAALVLAAAGLGPARRAGRLPAITLVALVAALVALGDSTPFGRLLHAMPLVGQLRSWGRATVALDLAVAVLAAYGVAAVRMGLPAARRAATAAAGAMGLVAVVGWLSPHRAPGAHTAWALALPLVAAALAVASVRLPRSVAGPALVAVVGLDMLLSFGWWHRWRVESPTTAEAAAALDPDVAPAWGPAPDAAGGIERVAFAFEDPLDAVPDVPRVTGAKRIRTVGGYDPLAPSAYLAVVGVDYRGAADPSAPVLDPGSHVPDLLRVTWVVDADLEGRRRTPALPEAFLVGEARSASHDEAVAAARGDRPLDPSATALVERCDRCAPADEPGPAGVVGPVRWGPSSATVAVDAERDAVLVLSQAWAPGWSARVDGEAAPVVRVDGIVQGVPVTAGAHVVALRFQPPGLRAGAAVSGCALLGLIALSARSRTTSAGPGPASTSPPRPTPGTRTRTRRRPGRRPPPSPPGALVAAGRGRRRAPGPRRGQRGAGRRGSPAW